MMQRSQMPLLAFMRSNGARVMGRVIDEPHASAVSPVPCGADSVGTKRGGEVHSLSLYGGAQGHIWVSEKRINGDLHGLGSERWTFECSFSALQSQSRAGFRGAPHDRATDPSAWTWALHSPNLNLFHSQDIDESRCSRIGFIGSIFSSFHRLESGAFESPTKNVLYL
jgi:hypothetical protein